MINVNRADSVPSTSLSKRVRLTRVGRTFPIFSLVARIGAETLMRLVEMPSVVEIALSTRYYEFYPQVANKENIRCGSLGKSLAKGELRLLSPGKVGNLPRG